MQLTHEKASLGGLGIDTTIKTIRTSRFGIQQQYALSSTQNSFLEAMLLKKCRVPGYPGTRQKNGYPGTLSSKWHYPAGRVGSGLQNMTGTRSGGYPQDLTSSRWVLIGG